MTDQPEDSDLTAAIYVIGSLEPRQFYAVEQTADEDATLAEQIEKWRYRLAPLAAGVRPVPPPPNLWRRIEVTLGFATIPVVTQAVAPPGADKSVAENRLRRRVRYWRWMTLLTLALAMGGAAAAYLERQTPPRFVALLAPADAPKAAFVAQLEPGNALLVRPVQPISVQPGRDLELWVMSEGDASPRSLGVLPAIGRRLTIRDLKPSETQLSVSLEPAGGSTTGAPTGPTLYGGTLEEME